MANISTDDYRFLLEKGIDYIRKNKGTVTFVNGLECFLSLSRDESIKYAVGAILLVQIRHMEKNNVIPSDISLKMRKKVLDDL